jgi:hypothetical protein
MTQLQFLLDWIQYAVVVAFCVSLLLPFALMPIWKWWKDSFGVNLQVKDFAIAAALLAAFLHYVFGVDPSELWFKYLQAVAITSIPIVLVWRFQIIYREQKQGARHRRSTDAKHSNGGENATTRRKRVSVRSKRS